MPMWLISVASLVAARESPAPLPPWGAKFQPRLLSAFSGHSAKPPLPAFERPRIVRTFSVRPRLRITKRLSKSRGALTCTVDLDGRAHLDVSVRDPLLRGQLELDGLAQSVSYSKLWLFPGLSDAATRVELRTGVDLRTGRKHGELRLGLRGVRKVGPNTLSLVHRVPLLAEAQLGVPVRADLDVGATLKLPDELKLGTAAGSRLRDLAAAAQAEVDLDRLDLCVGL
jgi:hypothetical protein